MNSALLGQLKALNVIRPEDEQPPFQGASDLNSLPANGPERRNFIDAIVCRLDSSLASERPANDFLDNDWQTLMPSYLEQLTIRKSSFLPDFVAHLRFLPSIVSLAKSRSTASRATSILLNTVASCDTPSALCRRLLNTNLIDAINHILTASDSTLDALLQAAELLAIVTMFSGDRRSNVSKFVVEQKQLAAVAARGFVLSRSLYDDLLNEQTGMECFTRRCLELSESSAQFDWERSPRLVAKLTESLSKSFMFLHTTASEELLSSFLEDFEDGTPAMAKLTLQCLPVNGGVVPALPISVTGTNLADLLAVVCNLDPLFMLEKEINPIHFCSNEFSESCQKRWRFQQRCINRFLEFDDDQGNLIHQLVHWVATDPRSKPAILEGRKRFHPESELDENAILEFIGQILSTTQSALSCLANISRVQPMLTAVASELTVFYQSLSELGTDAYGDDVRLIGYETTTPKADSVTVHVTPTIFEGLALILVNQHFRHGEPLAIETSQLEVIARTTAAEAKARGNELISSGQFDAAIAAYTTAINLLDFDQFRDSEEFVSCIANRSEAYLRKDNFRSAYVDASRAVQLRPDNAKFQRRFENAKSKC